MLFEKYCRKLELCSGSIDFWEETKILEYFVTIGEIQFSVEILTKNLKTVFKISQNFVNFRPNGQNFALGFLITCLMEAIYQMLLNLKSSTNYN